MSQLLTAQYGVENIVKSFGGAKALDNVSLKVQSGEVHCIAGENGSGKSTLIKIMSGVHAPDSGQIYFGEKLFPLSLPVKRCVKAFRLFSKISHCSQISQWQKTLHSLHTFRKFSLSKQERKQEACTHCARSHWCRHGYRYQCRRNLDCS